jgi:hypothetical protein
MISITQHHTSQGEHSIYANTYLRETCPTTFGFPEQGFIILDGHVT